MVSILVAFSFALLLTSLFALRFPDWRKPLPLALYFTLFFATEWIVSWALLPPGALGMETAWVCLALTIPVAIAASVARRFEDEADDGER